MANLIELEGNKYIESKNIRVFPCAYRGYYKSATSKVFDPEARSTTEANFTNTFHKLSSNKETYVVSWLANTDGTGTLKCVIGGYYFEIYNHKMEDFFYDKDLPYYLCIKTKSVDLSTGDADATDDRKTTILDSFIDTENYLDVKQKSGDSYGFTGLALSTEAIGNAQLQPFTAGVSFVEAGKTIEGGSSKFNPNNPSCYYLDDKSNTLIEITKAEEYPAPGTQLYLKATDYKVDPAKLAITSILDAGIGNYSIKMNSDRTESGTNSTIASGDYSVALGKATIAANTGAVAFGNSTEASGEGSFAAGNDTKAANKGSVALGTNTVTNADNQVVIGQYNTEDATQAFIVANGTSEASSNKFTVSKTGNVKALGNLEVTGSIKATGRAANDLELGTTGTGTGSIKVYGTGSSEIFKVENTGNTTIAGTTEITNTTGYSSTITGEGEAATTTHTAAFKVGGGVHIGENLNVVGNTTIGGTTTIGNNLTATNGTASFGNTNISGTADITGPTTIGSSLGVTGATTVGSTLGVTGNTTIGGTLTAAKKLTVSSEGADITGNSKVTGTFEATGATTLNDTLTVGTTTTNKKTTLYGELEVTGTTKLANKVNINTAGVVTGIKDLNATGLISTDDSLHAKSLIIYTTAGNEGFKVDNAGVATIYDNLTIGNEAKVVIDDGKITTDSDITATGNITSRGGNISGANISASNTLSAAAELTIGPSASPIFKVTDTEIKLKATKINIGDSAESATTEIVGTLKTTGETTLANSVTITPVPDTVFSNITGIKDLTAKGKIEAMIFNATSDLRKKTNIKDYKCEKSILDLPIKSFEYINDETHTKYIGCIAQDLQEICPEIVTTDKEGFLSIQESKLVYLLLREVKELKEKLNQLEGR